MSILGIYRELEYFNNTQERAIELTIERVEEFLQEKSIQKHVKKILSMTVGGFIENYVEKHLLLDLINFVGKEFGYPEISKEYQKYYHKYGWGNYVGLSNEQLAKIKEEEELRRNSFSNKDILL